MAVLQVDQIAAPSFGDSNRLLVEAGKTFDRAFDGAAGVLKDFNTGQQEKNDVKLAGEIAALGSEEDLAGFLEAGSFNGSNISPAMTKRIAELRGTVLGFEQDRADIGLTGAQTNSANASASATSAASNRANSRFNTEVANQKLLGQRQILVDRRDADNLANGGRFGADGAERPSSFRDDVIAFDIANPSTRALRSTAGQQLGAISGAAGTERLSNVQDRSLANRAAEEAKRISQNPNLSTGTDAKVAAQNSVDTEGLTPVESEKLIQDVVNSLNDKTTVTGNTFDPVIQGNEPFNDFVTQNGEIGQRLRDDIKKDKFARALDVADTYESDPVESLKAALGGTDAGTLGTNAISGAINELASSAGITAGQAAYALQIAREQSGTADSFITLLGDGLAQSDALKVAKDLFNKTRLSSTREILTDTRALIKNNERKLKRLTTTAKRMQKESETKSGISQKTQAQFNAQIAALNGGTQTGTQAAAELARGGASSNPNRSTEIQELIDGTVDNINADNRIPTAATNAALFPQQTTSQVQRQLGAPTDAGRVLREFFGGSQRR